jgi:hypothetical protein
MRVPFIAAWAKPDTQNPHQQRLPVARGAIQSQQAAVYDLFRSRLYWVIGILSLVIAHGRTGFGGVLPSVSSGYCILLLQTGD